MQASVNEKRQAKRFASQASVTVTSGQNSYPGKCINESKTGVLIALSQAIAVDSPVEIQQNEQVLTHKGQIVRLIEDDSDFLIAVKY